jgi:hypothetical protein
MSHKTLEVELEHGQVRTNAAEGLPAKAHALLTSLETRNVEAPRSLQTPGAGLGRFLSRRDFPLAQEPFQASLAAHFWEQ